MSATKLTKTALLKNEFAELIDDDIEYSVKDMKDVLASIFKNIEKNINKENKEKKGKKTIVKKNTATIVVDDSSDDDKPKKRGRPAKPVKKDKYGNVVAKKAPSPYNLFVKDKIVEIRIEQPDVPAKERMSLAAAAWKELSDDDKTVYINMKKDMEAATAATTNDDKKTSNDDDVNSDDDAKSDDEEQ